MRKEIKESHFQTYGFRFKGKQQENVAGLDSLGWDKKMKTSNYNWDGINRNEFGKVIFQYTLSGNGKIIIDEKHYELKTGDAFLVYLPSKHRYFLPDNSQSWEFIFITINGQEAINNFNTLKSTIGQVFSLEPNSPPISYIFDLLEKAAHDELHDSYQSSEYAYSFIMKLSRHLLYMDNKSWPESINQAVIYIRKNYQEPIVLDDIVQVTGMSKYHFSRLFHDFTQHTPMQYVTKVRMEQAIKLLKNPNLSIIEISHAVGYANSNYFNKVFRSFFGVSPGKYRKGKTFLQFDHIVID